MPKNKMLTLEPRPKLNDVLKLRGEFNDRSLVNDNFLHYLSSGKAAISMLLDYFREYLGLINKNSSFFVPYWIGSPVYQEIASRVIPCAGNAQRCDIYLMYHQYGYRQDVSRYRERMVNPDAIIIEDLAHRIEGPVIDIHEHTNHHYAIYSFSKFTYCNMLGGVKSNDEKFHEWIYRKRLKKSNLMNLFKLVDEINIRRINFEKLDPFLDIRKIYFSLFSTYARPIECSIKLYERKIQDEINERSRNYEIIKKLIREHEIFPNSNYDCNAPYAIPLRFNEAKIDHYRSKLFDIGIRAGKIHFDYNHNNLEPGFEKALLIPCHSQLKLQQIEQMCEIIMEKL